MNVTRRAQIILDKGSKLLEGQKCKSKLQEHKVKGNDYSQCPVRHLRRVPYPGCAVLTSHVREYVSLWNSQRRHNGGKSEACSDGYHKHDRHTTLPEIQKRELKTRMCYDKSSERNSAKWSTRGIPMRQKESRELSLKILVCKNLIQLILSIAPKGT